MFAEDENITENQAMAQLKSLEKDIVRTAIIKDKKRIDGRGLADVRQIKCEVGVCQEHMVLLYLPEVKHKH